MAEQGTGTKFITGRVTSVNLKGSGPNSAQLLFTVRAGKKKKHQPVVAAAAHEPQLFAGMSAFVTAAYFFERRITVGYRDEGGPTPIAIEVFTPSSK